MNSQTFLLFLAMLWMTTIVSLDASADDIPATQPKPLEFNALIEIATRHHMAMPPKDAKLVLAHTGWHAVPGSRSTSRDPAIYSPAFLLEGKSDGSVVVLRGTELEHLNDRSPGEALYLPFSTKEVEPVVGGHASDFSRLSAFVCAIQAAAMGQRDAAGAIWNRVAETGYWDDDSFDAMDDQPSCDDVRALLARALFNHLRAQMLESPADWKQIQLQMSELVKEFADLNVGRRRDLFQDLSATVNAAPAKPGSVEALLLDWSCRQNNMRHLGLFSRFNAGDGDAPAREIVLRGHDAVPELLALIDDRRVTVHEFGAFMRAPAGIHRVGVLARTLLGYIAGSAVSDCYNDEAPAALQAWWKKAQTQGERVALADGVFTREEGKIKSIVDGPVRIIAKKYPEDLGSLCDTFSNEAASTAQSADLAETVAGGDLPKHIRVQILSKFAQAGSIGQRRFVLGALATLDQQKCIEMLRPLLATFPKDASGSYWTCPEAAFTHVVMQLEDDAIWREYLRVAKRSSVGLRMEMMNPMNYAYIGTKNRQRRLAFLAAFLDDTAVRDLSEDKERSSGPSAGYTIPKLAVRDFAAACINGILEMREFPDEFWTPDQWATLRKTVRERLAKEQLPDL